MTDTAAALSSLQTSSAGLQKLPIAGRVIDPAKGLSPTDIAVLAVLNSPDLKAKRAVEKVAAAQVFAARLFPDPQVTLSMDIPNPGQIASTAYGIAPTLDVAALISHSTALKAARDGQRQVDLDLLWAEWSVAQQARILAATIVSEESKAVTLDAFAEIASTRAARSAEALKSNNLAALVAEADLAVKIDADTQAASAHAMAKKARLDLNALIGLQPNIHLRLVSGESLADLDAAAVQGARETLSRRRPDLIALQAGYSAQEAVLRKSVLAQFPLLNLGLNHAQDNTGILSNGPSATLTLPIFRTARGPVAIEAATRDQLRIEYQARLDQSDADCAAALEARNQDRDQARRLALELPTLQQFDSASEGAFHRGDIDGATYVAEAQTYFSKVNDLEDRLLAAQTSEILLEATLFLPPALVTEARP